MWLFKSKIERKQQIFFFITGCVQRQYHTNANYAVQDVRQQYMNNVMLGMGFQPSGLKPQKTSIRSEDFYNAIVVYGQEWADLTPFSSDLGWEEKMYIMALIKNYLKSNYNAKAIDFLEVENSPAKNYVVVKVSAKIPIK